MIDYHYNMSQFVDYLGSFMSCLGTEGDFRSTGLGFSLRDPGLTVGHQLAQICLMLGKTKGRKTNRKKRDRQGFKYMRLLIYLVLIPTLEFFHCRVKI